jgi:hypothetical protein
MIQTLREFLDLPTEEIDEAVKALSPARLRELARSLQELGGLEYEMSASASALAEVRERQAEMLRGPWSS